MAFTPFGIFISESHPEDLFAVNPTDGEVTKIPRAPLGPRAHDSAVVVDSLPPDAVKAHPMIRSLFQPPKKRVHHDKQLTMRLTANQFRVLDDLAYAAGMSHSEYLRTMALLPKR